MNLDRIIAGVLIANFVWGLPQFDFGTYAPLYGYSAVYALLVCAIFICIALFCAFAIWRAVIGWRAAAWLYIGGLVVCLLVDAYWRYGLSQAPDMHKPVWVGVGQASIVVGLADVIAAYLLLSRVLSNRVSAPS